MPKVTVYLPDELYREARERKLPLSSLAQEAVERAIREDSNARWIERMRARPPRVGKRIDTAALMDEVREEFGA